MTPPFILKAPAKINLGLKIVGIRPDGYHEIESLFAPINLYDEIKIEILRGAKNSPHNQAPDKITFADGRGKTLVFENDTVSKALKLFRQNCGPIPPLNVYVKKNIPQGAGLGGGSADAGIFLRFLKNHFYPGDDQFSSPLSPPFSEDTLKATALEVGADVPFFLECKPALVSGIGEVIEPFSIEPLSILLIRPSFEVATSKAFGWFDEENRQHINLTHRNTDVTQKAITGVSDASSHSLGTLKVPEIVQRLVNDLTKSVAARHPEINEMQKALSLRGALGTLMSGTGCSVYGIFRSEADAHLARESLQASLPSDYAYFVCATLE